ncbi:MAG TPA: autotransporter outer membrane beta-barrel domain-containing protein [Sphingobium sp.]|nr:autotransporter outer membrane beta-barrel domain-containing protein [Sphingobium sp.]
MRTLRSSTFLTPLVLAALPAAASAQVSISTATTTPVRTSTANNGAAADLSVTADGSITLNSGSAITVDSNNNVSNAGKLVQGNANGANGIDVLAGINSTVTNSGAITITETFNALNEDGNSTVDGPVAKASNRVGILVRGAHSGNIVNSGTITIDGLNSAGIRVDGPLTGSLTSSDAISIIGDNSIGIKTGAVSGDINVLGPVNMVGKGAVAVDIGGDVGGVVRLQNTIGQFVTYKNDAGETVSLSRNDLRVGAPAVSIAGNVGGGIIVDTPPSASGTNPDVDGDGIPDANESSGAIQSFGNGPALRIGGASDTTIGAVSGDGHALVVKGTVNGNAYYSNTDAIGIEIGGQGGNVTLTGGLSVTGRVQATTNDSQATGLLIHAGSSVPVIDNSGYIVGSISAPGDGATYGIRDLSGTLTTINTNGYITASGTADDITDAIDVSANTTGVTINQFSPPDESAENEAKITTQITGNIRTGSGNDKLLVSDGAIKGNSFLGAGNDLVALSGDAIYQGRIDFGTGAATMTMADTSLFTGTAGFNDQAATLTIGGTARFSGKITGGSQLDVTVNGGILEATGTDAMSFDTLNVGANGTLRVNIDGTTQTSSRFVVNSATFADGAHVAATVTSLAQGEGDFVILTANQLIGTPQFSEEQTDLPLLFKGAISVDTQAKTVSLSIKRKTAGELGLSANQAAAYSAILAAAPSDAAVEASLLDLADNAALSSQFNGLMPDYAGGAFDLLTRGSRQAARHLANNNAMFSITNLGGWLEVLKWQGSKHDRSTPGFSTSGWGISAGLERATGIGNVGLSFDYLSGSSNGRGVTNHISASAYEFGAFWRVSKGPFYAFARGSYAIGKFDTSRTFLGSVNGTGFSREAIGSHDGKLYSGMAGLSYQADLTDRIAIKPMAIVDYYRLREDGFQETGGGDAMNLLVNARTSTSSTATTTVTGIYRMGPRTGEGIPLTFELEGGRRNHLGGKLGVTTAAFKDGQSFSVTPEQVKGGWLGELRVLSGGLDYTWTLAGAVEQTAGNPAYSIRASLGVAF